MRFDDLLGDLGSMPVLPGALCKGKGDLFDPGEGRGAHHVRAIELCGRCPALQPCEEWFESLSAKERPRGVVAGRLRGKV